MRHAIATGECRRSGLIHGSQYYNFRKGGWKYILHDGPCKLTHAQGSGIHAQSFLVDHCGLGSVACCRTRYIDSSSNHLPASKSDWVQEVRTCCSRPPTLGDLRVSFYLFFSTDSLMDRLILYTVTNGQCRSFPWSSWSHGGSCRIDDKVTVADFDGAGSWGFSRATHLAHTCSSCSFSCVFNTHNCTR